MSNQVPRASFLQSTRIPPYSSASVSASDSNSRASSTAGRSDAEEDSANDEDDSEGFLEPEDDDHDHDRSSASLNRLGPATPKSSHNQWPFSAIPPHHHPGTFPDGYVNHSAPPPKRADSMDQDRDDHDEGDADQGPPHIPASSLPHEILLHILRLLPPTALAPALRVCKAWCQCGVELLWHKPMFSSLPALYKMLQVLGQSSTQTFPYPEFVRRINFSNLTDEMSDKLLVKLLPCTRIERLTLTGCKNISSQSMVRLLSQSSRLVALDLSEVESVDNDVVTALADNCPRLQGLNLTGCSFVTDKGMEKLALGCPALRRIKLRKCDLITDVSIVLLSIHCPLLLEVDLGLCYGISSVSLQQVLRTSHNLRELCLHGCASLTDEGFPDPTSLSLVSSHHSSSYSSAQASPLASGSDQSSSDDPSRSSSPGPAPLTAPSGLVVRRPPPLSSPPPLHSFDHLRYLDLTSLALLSDQAIAGIVKFMPKIRNLILAKCTRLTDESLYEVCKVGKHLHYLHLGHVNSITDKAVTAIARSCTRLRYIDLACCNNLTDVSVLELAANLPRLKRIGLVRVTNITDASLDALHARTSLERIHLSYCSNLTVAGVNDLLQHLPRLTHLSLTEVAAFRRRVLQTFCRPPPKDFNDHQRRSFCVFSGRGVHDLRKFLRSLAPVELEALALPDPPSDADDAAAARFGGGGGGAGNQAAAHAHALALAQQHQLRQRLAAHHAHQDFMRHYGTDPLVNPTPTILARGRLRQLGQTAHGDAGAAGSALGGGVGLAAPFDESQDSDQAQNVRLRPEAMRPRPRFDAPPERAQTGGGAVASSSRLPMLPASVREDEARRNDIASRTAFGRPRLDRQNSLGLSGPLVVGRDVRHDEDEDDEDEEMAGTIPIQSVPVTHSNSMDLDEAPSASQEPANHRPPRPRRATVTRTNYRSSASTVATPATHRRRGGTAVSDEDDDEGEATGDEEDLSMGDA